MDDSGACRFAAGPCSPEPLLEGAPTLKEPARCRNSEQTTAEGSMSFPTIFRSVSGGSGKSRGCHGRRWPGASTLIGTPCGDGRNAEPGLTSGTAGRCLSLPTAWASAMGSPGDREAPEMQRGRTRENRGLKP